MKHEVGTLHYIVQNISLGLVLNLMVNFGLKKKEGVGKTAYLVQLALGKKVLWICFSE